MYPKIQDAPAIQHTASSSSLNRFGELGQEALNKILPLTSGRTLFATQLSDILGARRSFDNSPLHVSDLGRSEIESSYLSVGSMKAFGYDELIMWAPRNPLILSNLLSIYSKYVAQTDSPWGLSLVTVVPLPYGCASWSDLQDLWQFPLFSPRWAPLVKTKFFFSQPLQIVLPSDRSPSIVHRHLAVFSCGKQLSAPIPKVIASEGSIGSFVRGSGIFFDTPLTCAGTIRYVVHNSLADLPFRFLEQQRSPASSTSLPRIRLHLVFPPGAISDMDLTVVLLDLRRKIDSPLTAIAQDNIFRDNSALLADISNADALWGLLDFCTEAAFISEHLVTIKTDISELRWKDKLRDLFHDNPHSCCSALRWRSSRLGGTKWVSGPSCKPLLDAANRVAARPYAVEPPFFASVHLRGNAGYAGIEILRNLLKDPTTVGSSITEVANSADLSEGSWALYSDTPFGEVVASARINFWSPEDLLKCRSLLHHRPVHMLEGSDLTIEMLDDHTSASLAKNQARRGRLRQPPPAVPPSA